MDNNNLLEPSVYEQYMLELVNRARLNPDAEAARYSLSDLNQGLTAGTITSDPKQPLAFNLLLIDSARKHSQWMSDNNIFSHTGEGNSNPGDRMAAAGYSFTGSWSWGENVAWKGTTGVPNVTQYIADEHRSLFLSDGHRKNILKDNFKEIGIGTIQDTFNGYNAVLTTQNFAYSGSSIFLTGVAFDDSVTDDSFYTVGEGLGGIEVKAIRQSDNQVFTTNTMTAGGYQMPLSAGTYSVKFFQNGAKIGATNSVTINSQNVKLDLDTSNLPSGNLRVEAEDYTSYFDTTTGNSGNVYRNDNVDIQATSDTGGGFNLGWMAPGEWLLYDVNIPETGLYQLVPRVASSANQNSLDVSLDGKNASFDFGSTGGWQAWKDLASKTVQLTAGSHQLRVDVGSSGFNLNYIDLIPTEQIRVEGEDYTSYFDTTTGNSGKAYRNDNVDIQPTSDTSGNFNLGWIAQGEWLLYDVAIPETGLYKIVPRVASSANQNSLDVSLDGKNASFNFGSTGGSQTWKDLAGQTVQLTAGNHELRLDLNSSNFNFNYLELIPAESIRVEAESYTSYFDTTTGNSGKVYRNDNVDIQPTSDITGDFNLGWVAQGEWLVYDVDIPTTGSYQIVPRVASNSNQAHSLDVSLDGETASFNFGSTGGWQTWEDLSGQTLQLTAGSHELRLDFNSSSVNLNYIDLIPVGEI